MKLARTLLYGFLASAPLSAAATLPIDRPTPPPCCVDGVCHVHGRYGYFPTRWRTWPGLGVAPMPTLHPPDIKSVPGLPAIEPPTPEEEDRQAPEPTKAASPPPLDFAPPSSNTPRTAPLDSQDNRGPGGTAPTPRSQGPAGSPMPLGPQPLGPQPLGPQPLGPQSTTPSGSTGVRSPLDFDQPPSPPSANFRSPTPPAVQQAAALQPTAHTATTPKSRPTVEQASVSVAPSSHPRRPESNDPPPLPPLAFRGASL